MARGGDITEATELSCLLSYLAEMTRVALEHFTMEDISAEEAMNHAVREWESCQACQDAKEE